MAGRVSKNRAKKSASKSFLKSSGRIGAETHIQGSIFGEMPVTMRRNRY